MARSGTVIRKFFLNVSKKEQKRRFLARLEEPEKNWKFSAADIHERAILGRLSGCVRRDDPQYGDRACSLVRRAGG